MASADCFLAFKHHQRTLQQPTSCAASCLTSTHSWAKFASMTTSPVSFCVSLPKLNRPKSVVNSLSAKPPNFPRPPFSRIISI